MDASLDQYYDQIKTEKDFQKSLYKLKEIFRSCAIKKSEEKIDTTVSFIILKYISEMENGKRTIGKEMAKRLGKALNISYKVFL